MKPPITLKFKSKTDVRYFNPVVHLLKKYLQMCIEEPPILSPVTPKQNFSDDYENFDFPQEKIQQ
jgi:hypothetical protein